MKQKNSNIYLLRTHREVNFVHFCTVYLTVFNKYLHLFCSKIIMFYLSYFVKSP